MGFSPDDSRKIEGLKQFGNIDSSLFLIALETASRESEAASKCILGERE